MQVRWKHVHELIDEYLRRLELTVERAFSTGWNELDECIEPLYNAFVGPSEVVLTIDLPYANPDTVKVNVVADDVIEVQATTKRKITFRELGIKHRVGEFSAYRCRIHLPVAVDESGITQKLKRGILEVHLPRSL
jgi:HSP20 family molecular chaperone IbpA